MRGITPLSNSNQKNQKNSNSSRNAEYTPYQIPRGGGARHTQHCHQARNCHHQQP